MQQPQHQGQQIENESRAVDSSKCQNFDFVNWFYWSLWWQQCCCLPNPQYWAGLNAGLDGTGSVPAQTAQPTTGVHPAMPQTVPGIGIHIRIINGYETVIAPLWKRLVAEFIDMFLFGIILKLYIPDFEYRVPEIIFETNEVWKNIDEEELLEIRKLVMHFMVSTAVQRFTHAFFETIFLWLLGWTPGKWLMGLRVMKCADSHLTRTMPGYSVRIKPGGKISLIQAALRSLFKGTVSAFIPLVIFFFNITHGRTRYDRLFGSMVVDVSALHRPLFVNGQGVNQIVNFNINQGRGGPQVQVQIRR